MKAKEKHYKVTNGDVQLAVSESGQGQTLLFFNGVGATQVTWKKITRELGGQYQLVTFDFRSHGKASISHNNSIESFQTNAQTITDEVVGDQSILVA